MWSTTRTRRRRHSPRTRYPDRNQIESGRYASGTAGKIGDIGGALAPTVARQFAPKVASSLVEGGMKSAGMGAGASLGLGLATELGGSLLKPKQDMPTASPFADITDKYGRRMEGSGEGIAGGAVKWGGRGAQIGSAFGGPIGMGIGAGIGALGGAIANAFTKNAKSAATDFSREDATKAIQRMYATQGGPVAGAWGGGADPASGGAPRRATSASVRRDCTASLNDLVGQLRQGAATAARGCQRIPTHARSPWVRNAARDPMTGLPVGNTGVHGGAGAAGAPASCLGDVINAETPAPSTVDQSKWNTDSYAKPAYIAQNPGKVMPGFDEQEVERPEPPDAQVRRRQHPESDPRGHREHGSSRRRDRQGVPRRAAHGQRRRDDPRCRQHGHPCRRRRGRQAVARRIRKRWRRQEGRRQGGVDTSGIQSARDAAGGSRGLAGTQKVATSLAGNDIASIIARLGQHLG